jgi:hypothetical protein
MRGAGGIGGGGRRRVLLAAMSAMIALVAPSAAVPAAAAVDDPLSEWALVFDVEDRSGSPNSSYLSTARYVTSGGAPMTWTGTYLWHLVVPGANCPQGGDAVLHEEAGGGSGGVVELGAAGFGASAFGLALDQVWTAVTPNPQPGMTGTSRLTTPCDTTTSPVGGLLPRIAPVFLPGSLDDLARLPVGTVLQDTYSSTDVYGPGTLKVSYTATKISAQDVDTDRDGVVDPLDACPTVAGNPAAAGCPDADLDGVRDSADNCPVIHNPGQQNSDSVGPGDACEPVDAVDDPASGVIYVDYDGNQNAPPTEVGVLGNDVGGGRVLTNISTSAKGTPTASAGSGVTFTPPHKRFVGPVEFSYGIRLRLDPPNTVRDSARVRLVYRACRTHTLTMAGTNLGMTTDYVRAKARLRVCTDGVTASSTVLSQSTWKKPFHTTGLRLLNKAIGAAVAGATRGALKLELTAGWTAVAKPGDSGVAARYVGCDRWTVAARYEHLSEKKRLAMANRLRDRLGKVVGEKAAKALAKAVISHDFDLGCSTHVGYRSTMGAASSTGYDIKIRTTRNTGSGIEGTRLQADTSNNRGAHGLFTYHCPLAKDALHPTDSVIHVSGCRLIEN